MALSEEDDDTFLLLDVFRDQDLSVRVILRSAEWQADPVEVKVVQSIEDDRTNAGYDEHQGQLRDNPGTACKDLLFIASL